MWNTTFFNNHARKMEKISSQKLDLSKVFDTTNHNILLVKLHAYGFSKNTLNLMYSSLRNKKETEYITNNNFSATKTVITRVPQDSIEDPFIHE